MAIADRTSAPPSLEALVERFDPTVFDAPDGPVRIRLAITDGESWDALVDGAEARLELPDGEPDALLRADAAAWEGMTRDLRGGMQAFRRGRLHVRCNLHLGVGFLAATSGMEGPGRLRFESVRTRSGKFSILEAGTGPPIVSIPGLGGTKISFLPTLAALADDSRVIAVAPPGFGDSNKPIGAPYDAPWFADTIAALLDALELERAHVV